MHWWVGPDPVAEAMGPGVLQREGGDAREPRPGPDSLQEWIEPAA